MRRIVNAMALMAALAGIVMPSSARAERTSAEAQADPPLELVRTIPVGGSPDSIVVDCWSGRNDVVFYDLASSKIKFLDGDSLQLTPDEIYLPHRGFDSWMSYDRNLGHAYLLQVVREFDWDNLMVTVLNRRTLVRSFSVNEEFNANLRVDFPYVVTGLAFKPSSLEIGQPGRLVVDNGYGGRLDIVDLDAVGLKARYAHRHPYRQPLTSPVMERSLGSSVALEPKHETTIADDLAYNDRVYLMDTNTSDTRIRTFDVWSGGAPDVREKSVIDFSGIWPFSNGVEGLFVNGPVDQLLVGTAIQSGDDGFAASVGTTGTTVETLRFPHMDPGFLLADWYDPKRIFVATFDDFGNDPNAALRLRLLYGDDVYSVILEAHFITAPTVRDMAFDPYHRRLYITAEDKIYVVQVNVGASAPPLPAPRPTAASTVLPAPWYGGQLEAPEERAVVTFPASSVNTQTEVVYGETLNPPATGHRLAVRAFELAATETASGDAVTRFLKPYYMTLAYTQPDLGLVDEATCALYRWNGSTWVRVPGASFDRGNNEVTGSLDSLGYFAILGEAAERGYLPALMR